MASETSVAVIINRGRGPEIAGTRITVFDVMDYLKAGWHRDRIAGLFRLSSSDIQAAINYIQRHREEVEADYQHILERHRTYRYAPDVSAKIERSRGTARQRMEEIRQRSAREAADAKDHG
ncbi:MAG: DUF433 domain-containing protein [Rhodopirellula sp.]|nr:DUF433 domain-containing protein [Rhodopirellula sp.]